MKLISLRKRIIRNISISVILSAILGLIIFYSSHKKESEQKEAQRIQAETSNIRSKTIELQNKVSEATKYEEIWKTISNNRKIIGNPKIDDITSKIDELSEKYSIEKPTIKMNLPEDLESGIFNRSTVKVSVSVGSLTFDAISDTKAISFITELSQSMPGYIIISNFEINKTKDYSDQDLVQISSGKPAGAISAKVDFFWYIYKSKQPQNKK